MKKLHAFRDHLRGGNGGEGDSSGDEELKEGESKHFEGQK